MLTCTYPGDCTELVIGQIMGPDNAGGLLEAVAADYDALSGRTRVRFRPVPPDDQRAAYRDSWGLLRVLDGDQRPPL